jgi:hypothetical protein
MRTTGKPHVRSLWIAIAVLGAAIAGCGSTGHPSRTAASARSGPNTALQFSQCMRANGLPNFPDPGPGGYQITPGSGINPLSPANQAAFNACEKYLPQSGHPPPIPQSERQQELKFAQCMRANGVPNFPDPGANGAIQFPIDSPIPQSPAFQRAQNGPCKKYLGR